MNREHETYIQNFRFHKHAVTAKSTPPRKISKYIKNNWNITRVTVTMTKLLVIAAGTISRDCNKNADIVRNKTSVDRSTDDYDIRQNWNLFF